MTGEKCILLYGIGNPGRQDDGLGPACAKIFEAENFPHVSVEANYQLAIEDSADIAAYRAVIFMDAAVNSGDNSSEAPFSFERIIPEVKGSFTSHILDPRTLLAAVRDLFNAVPEAYIMKIHGYAFDGFGEEMSEQAARNLRSAAEFLRDFVNSRQEWCNSTCNAAVERS